MESAPGVVGRIADILGRPVPPIDILDIGAMLEEGGDHYDPLLAQGLARVTGFEPNPAEFARLVNRPGPYRYLPVFLGDGGTAKFHLTRYPGCSSLLEPDPAVINLFETMGCEEDGNFRVVRTEQVQTSRLDDLPADIKTDYIKIDIQGAELMVLQNGPRLLAKTLVVETEAEFIPLYRGQPLFGDLQCFLRDYGFVLHKFVDFGGRPFRPLRPRNMFAPISQAMWADAVFVRDFSRLDRYSDDDLIKAATILHVSILRSRGSLLARIRSRQAGGLWRRYSSWLTTCDLPNAAVTFATQPTFARKA